MAIEKQDFFNLTHYEYGEAYFGSCSGMRYRLAREPLANVHFTPPEKRDPATLMATVWPEPYAYGMTDPAEMTSEHFEISEEGLSAAVEWLQGQYESRKAEWDEAKRNF